MYTEQLCINGVDMLKIHRAVRAGLKLISVDIIIVKAHKNGRFSMHSELCCQSVCRGGFARGAGACKHNCLCASFTYHICNFRELFFVQSLVYTYKLADLATPYVLVEIGYRFASHKLAPVLALSIYAEEVGTVVEHGYLIRILNVGKHQDEALFGGKYIE